MSYKVDSADLTCAKDAIRAVSNVCITETTRFVIRGIAGEDEPIFLPGERIHRTDCDHKMAVTAIAKWFAQGRTITDITLYHI